MAKRPGRGFLGCLLDLNLSGPTNDRAGVPQYLRVAAGVDLGVSVCCEMVEDIRHVSEHVQLVHMNLRITANGSTLFEMNS